MVSIISHIARGKPVHRPQSNLDHILHVTAVGDGFCFFDPRLEERVVDSAVPVEGCAPVGAIIVEESVEHVFETGLGKGESRSTI